MLGLYTLMIELFFGKPPEDKLEMVWNNIHNTTKSLKIAQNNNIVLYLNIKKFQSNNGEYKY